MASVAVLRRDVDWTFAALVAFSCSVHFGVVAWTRLADWPIDETNIPEAYADFVVGEIPPLAWAPTSVSTDAGEAPSAAETEAPPVLRAPRAAVPRRPGEETPLSDRVRRQGILQVLTTIGQGTGTANDVLAGGSGSADLDEVLAAMSGVGFESQAGSLRPRGGGAGEPGAVADIGHVQIGPGGEVASEDALVERPARGVARAAPPEPTGGTGDLPESDVASVVRRRISAIRTCYERQLRHDRTLAGRIVVDFTIGGAGTVTSARAVESTLADPEVAACVVSTFRRFHFPAPTGGAVRFSFPFVFLPAR